MGSRLEANSSSVKKRIERHRFEDEQGEEYGASKFGGFNDYFRRKKIKLQNLDAERRSQSSSSKANIFRGVVAHVNGYTQPSLNDIHTLIVDHGGGFMQYLDGKTTVTHIIASNLTPKKKVEFRRYRIVKPAWVVESVAAGKLLPWDDYRVLDEGIGQKVLGFNNGTVVSQANSQRSGYRDQTDTSWYTSQLRSTAEEVNNRNTHHPTEMPFPSAHPPTQFDEDISHDNEHVSLSASEEAQNAAIEIPVVRSHNAMQISNFDPATHLDDRNFSFDAAEIEQDTKTQQARGVFSSGRVLGNTESPQEASPDCSTSVIEGLVDDNPTIVSPSKKNTRMATAGEHSAALLADPKVWKSTGVNPGFLKQYYEESRLHHLSHWKAELKSQLQALATQKSSTQKDRQKRPPGSRRYILHVDFDSFFAAVSLKKYPDFVDKPAVVAHGDGSGSEIASCNYPAREYGVKNGMWMKTAKELCPGLKVLPYDFKAYEDASRDFYEAVIDTDGIVQSVSVDEALVDVSTTCIEASGHNGKGIHEGSIWREQAKADEIARELRNTIKQKTGCAVSIGIGGNILQAKVALRKAKPAGQYQLKPEEVLDFIGNLDVQDLPGVAYSIGGKLEEIGIKLVKDVRNLTKERLITTLGPKTGEKIWDFSRGIDRTEVGDQVVRKSVSAEVNWGIRFVTQEQADEFVQSLCEELQKRLVNEKVKGRQLTMKIMRRAADAPLDPPKHLGHGKCDTFNKSITLGVATNAKEILGREAISIMHGWGFPPGELRGIGVQVTKLESVRGTLASPAQSSQKRRQFTTPSKKLISNSLDPIENDLKSLTKLKPKTIHPAAITTAQSSSDHEPEKLLNTLGTQFVLPTQVDPEVLAELPVDIRSKLFPSKITQSQSLEPETTNNDIPAETSRPNSPAHQPDLLPTQSQLDKEALDALPPDIRAEVLAFYHKSPPKPQNQSVLPQSPRKNRSIKVSSKKLTTPTKKRTGLLFRGKQSTEFDANCTLTQSNFVACRTSATARNTEVAGGGSDIEEVSEEFLSALPEDIRGEVLAQQRQARLKKHGGINVNAKKKPQRSTASALPSGQHRLQLPPRPPKPTFTAQKLSTLPDLREATSAWFEEFKDDGPYEEDVDALVTYLRKVISEEKDMSKAVGIVKWLIWLVEGDAGNRWKEPLDKVVEGVQEAVKGRGLGPLTF